MANYPSPPSNRIAYDLDGSVLVKGVVTMSAPNLAAINDESNDGVLTDVMGGGGSNTFALLFPQPLDLVAFFMMFTQNLDNWSVTNLQYSPDTTNGTDGTWTTAYASVPYKDGRNANVAPDYRTLTHALATTATKGVRFTVNKVDGAAQFASTINAFHLYGRIHTPSFLLIYDPILPQEVAASYFDWGDIPQSSSDVRTFRVHNSSTLVAQNVTLTFNDLSPATPDQATWHYFSLDGVNYFSSVNIGNLAAGATSGIIYVERVTPANAQLGVTALRIVAAATFA